MATYSRGMSSSFIKDIQKALASAGFYGGAVDGVFGSLTESAVLAFQADQNLSVNGVIDSNALELLGLETAGQTTAAAGDYTDPDETRFNGLPGKPEIWKDSADGRVFVVYFVPDSEPPIPMLYSVASNDDLQSFFGDAAIKFDQILNVQAIQRRGGTIWGSTDTLPAAGGNPFAGFLERMERAKKTQPWIEDPDVFAVYANAYMEGREVERWELEGTDWWQTHNEAQRDWMWAVARDPQQAERILEDNFITVHETFRALGYAEPPPELITYLAEQASKGDWSTAYLNEQIRGMTDGDPSTALDAGLTDFMAAGSLDIGESAYKETDVRDIFARWLGPAFPPSDSQISSWAGKLRHGGDAAMDELTEYLRAQRLALYPEYENDSLTYDDIASPWRSFMTQIWGQTPDETSDIFQNLVKMNDSMEGGAMLRREGMKTGNQKVTQDALTGLMETTGGQIRRAV